MILLGARAGRIAGVLEVAGGLVGTLLGPKRIALPWRAMTLGHVILGIDEAALEQSRAHEHVHVRQYEQWGPILPAGLCPLQPLAARLWPALLPRQLVRAAGL